MVQREGTVLYKSFVSSCPMDTRKVHLLSRRTRDKNQPETFSSCREKNLGVYLNLLTVREKYVKSKKYQAWNYYADKDVVEEQASKKTSVDLDSVDLPPGHVTSVYVTKPERKCSARKSAKKVAFSVFETGKSEEERFPYIEPNSRASSQTRANTKLSDVTFGSKKSPDRKSAASTVSHASRDDELFKITFRSNSRESRRKYDPRSELHSDYYSIKKLSKSPRTQQRQQQQQVKHVSFPQSKQAFQAILLGSSKRMVKKFDKGNIRLPYYCWDKFNKVSHIRGYTSVPIF